VNRGKDKQKNK